MNLISSWWVDMRARRRAAQHGGVDFGDMGTAFGLDACLDQQPRMHAEPGAFAAPDFEPSRPFAPFAGADAAR